MMRLDDEIAVPAVATSLKYPFRDMKIGQSFVVPKTERNAARCAASTYKCRHRGHWNFTSKTEGDFTRFWRIACGATGHGA